jgi:DNA-binding response OmpR family regulator
MKKLLLIEDDRGISESLSLYLQQSEYSVCICADGDQAMSSFSECKPSLVILDLNLPGKNGFEICKEIRDITNTPIIILSARSGEEDKILGLELGADDYVSKPFSPRELLARIQSVLKRVSAVTEHTTDKLLFKTLSLDLENFQLFQDGSELKVTKTEFSLLKYLIDHHGTVVQREAIMKDIFGYDNYMYDRTIDTHMKNLRKKIGEDMIETVRGVGYRLI